LFSKCDGVYLLDFDANEKQQYALKRRIKGSID